MPVRNFLARIGLFYAGIIPISFGIGLCISANQGAAPWDIFHVGVANQLQLPIGLVIPGVGLALVLINLLMGIKPNLGTFLNMISIGPLVQFHLTNISEPSTTVGAWLMLAAGTLLIGVGTAAYTSASLGAGPRDGMMLGLTRALGKPIAWVKNSIDLTVCFVGWLLGGPIGVGTIFVAITIGYAVQFGMYLMRRLVRIPALSTVIRPPELRKGA